MAQTLWVRKCLCMLNMQAMNCENCGRPLSSAIAECKHCAAVRRGIPVFAYDPSVVHIPNEGPYTCPACHKHFEKCKSVLVPEKAPWWRFQQSGLACPHCGARLRWERITRSSPQWLAFHAIAIGSSYALLSGAAISPIEAAAHWFPVYGMWLRLGILCNAIYLTFAGEYPLQPYAKGGYFVEAWSQPPGVDNRWWPLGATTVFLALSFFMPVAWIYVFWLVLLGICIISTLGFVIVR